MHITYYDPYFPVNIAQTCNQSHSPLRNAHSLLRNSRELIMTFHITLGVQSSNKVDRKDKHITSVNGPHPFPTSKKYYSSQIKSLKIRKFCTQVTNRITENSKGRNKTLLILSSAQYCNPSDECNYPIMFRIFPAGAENKYIFSCLRKG